MPTKKSATPIDGARRREAPAYVEPMKALGVARIPPGEWLTEIKLDGYRALATLDRGRARLWSRNHRDLSAGYPEIIAALAELPCDQAVLDGEIVALDPEGRSRFQLLQQRGRRGGRPPILYFLFDLLNLDGRSFRDEPIEARKKALARLLRKPPDGLRLSPVLSASPEAALRAAGRHGLEGIVMKRPGSAYEPGRRSGAWVKRRISFDQEFVIAGFTPPGGSRSHFGAIVIGYYDEAGALRYAGKVGTGFTERTLGALHTRFLPLRTQTCPFAGDPPLREATWLKPRLVAQIKFSEWTGEGQLRQPVFLGLREDKPAREVRREIAAP